MPVMPGSPRPPVAAAGDDGVYRSIFQQPQLEFPAAAPSYSWFEFLLHPDALQRHLETLRHQNAHGTHAATSAMELVREFLDQAQLVADEGNGRNNRYRALLRLAAQVALEMQIPLVAVEQKLPPHFQRLLLDGIVDFAETSWSAAATANPATAKTTAMSPAQARLLHQRWTLRTLVRESQNGYLTCTTKHQAEEQMSGFQIALSELAQHHQQIAQMLQQTLVDGSGGDGGDDDKDKDALPLQTQFDAFYDLAVYFFSFNIFEKAYECFSRASELLEDHADALKLVAAAQSASLEGYLAACEAVLESRALADASSATPVQVQIEDALAIRDHDCVVDLLQSDIVADTMARCPPGYRKTLELKAHRLLRLAAHTANEKGQGVDGKVATRGAWRELRLFFKRVVLSNAVNTLALPTSSGDQSAVAGMLSAAVSTCLRLLQEEAQWAASTDSRRASLSSDLVEFLLRLCGFVKDRDPTKRDALCEFVSELVRHFPSILDIHGVKPLLEDIGLHPRDFPQPVLSMDQYMQIESLLRAGSKRQRTHFRMASDLHGIFAAAVGQNGHATDPAAVATTLRHRIMQLPDASALSSDRVTAKSLVVFLMLHGGWDALDHWRSMLLPSPPDQGDHALVSLLEFAAACGVLSQYIATTTVSDAQAQPSNFSVTRCNQIMSDLLAKRRAFLSGLSISVGADDADSITSTSSGSLSSACESEIAALLIDLPLWAVETLVCVCAGLLHRSSMRSLSDHRVSFDLNPYGDVALLVAFAADPPLKKPGTSTNSNTVSDPSNTSTSAVATQDAASELPTTPFLKAALPEIVALHARGIQCLVRRCPREPRWHSAHADLVLYPIVKLKQPSLSDPRAALCGYLSGASLATNYFSDDVSVVDIIDQSSLVRLSQCLIKVGAHVAAAVLYQCFAASEFKYGLRVLQITPESHDPAFFQYFWQLPFLELLVHLHSNPKHCNNKYVTLLIHLIQSPELNCSNPAAVQKLVEQRILRCFFRDLCEAYLA